MTWPCTGGACGRRRTCGSIDSARHGKATQHLGNVGIDRSQHVSGARQRNDRAERVAGGGLLYCGKFGDAADVKCNHQCGACRGLQIWSDCTRLRALRQRWQPT